jgi:hypothetical protein
MDLRKLPLEFEKFQALADATLDHWSFEGETIASPLTGGRSGSVVFSVDVRGGTRAGIRDGNYVLKLSPPPEWADQELETEAHLLAVDVAPEYAEKHIPKLVKSFADREGRGNAALYEIAGGSFESYAATDANEQTGFLEICEDVSREILTAWISPNPKRDAAPHEILEEWLGYRLNPTQAPDLFNFVSNTIRAENAWVYQGIALAHPIRFYQALRDANLSERPLLEGLLHNDLHGGNLLYYRHAPKREPYWIIDFGMSSLGPVGYDHAYMEFAHLFYSLRDYDPILLLRVLQKIDDPGSSVTVPEHCYPAIERAKRIRLGIAAGVEESAAKRRRDEFDRQLILARVAAGINWANKPLTDQERLLALCYAGWAAYNYIQYREPEELGGFLSTTSIPVVSPSESDEQEQLWGALHRKLSGFSKSKGRYVLVAEGLGKRDDPAALRSLGQLPWSAVIDLDPRSDEEGLHRHAVPLLDLQRAVRTFDDTIPTIKFTSGCAWMMAGGWRSSRRKALKPDEWSYDVLPIIRDLLRALWNSADPTPVHVVFLPGATLDIERPFYRLSRIGEAVKEATRGKATVCLMGNRKFNQDFDYETVPMSTDSFIQSVAKNYGIGHQLRAAAIPGQILQEGEEEPTARMIEVPGELLSAQSEDLTLLHSGVHDDDLNGDDEPPESRFWRGRPPTYQDLRSHIDVIREPHLELMDRLKAQLAAGGIQTVVFPCEPSSGGTTASMRIAWDLHWHYPTAILKSLSPSVVDHLARIAKLSGKPILIVAESNILQEAPRQEFLRGLRKRHVSGALLYVKRVFLLPKPNDDGDGGDLCLRSEMSPSEAEDFFRRYTPLAKLPARRQWLESITHNPKLKKYRSPFFYGLITFEKDYEGIDRYVEAHIKGVRIPIRDLMVYLAFVTVYSNSGIPESVSKSLIGRKPNSDLPITDMVGNGPARLIVKPRRILEAHPPSNR